MVLGCGYIMCSAAATGSAVQYQCCFMLCETILILIPISDPLEDWGFLIREFKQRDNEIMFS